MENQKLDNQFRERIYTTEVAPPAYVWENVAKELQRKRRRKFFLWLCVGGIVLAGLGIAFNRFASTPVAMSSVQSSEKAVTAQSLVAQPSLTDQIKDAAFIAPIAATSTEGFQTPTIRTGQAATALTQRVAKGSDPGSATDAMSMTSQTGEQAKAFDRPTDAAAQVNVDNQTELTRGIENTSAALPNNSPNAQVLHETTINSTLRTENTTQRMAIMPLLSSDLKPLTFLRTMEPIKTYPQRKKKSKGCYDFSGYRKAWLVDAYVGPEKVARSLSAHDPEYNAYLAKRENSERMSWAAFGLGVRGTLVYGPFLLRAGVHYAQHTEIFEYIDPNSIRTVIVRDSVFVGGVWQVTEKTVTEYGEKSQLKYNRFGTVDIPVLAGVELRKGHAGLSVNAGVSMNAYFWKKGTVLSPTLQPLPFSPKAPNHQNIYKSNVGLSVLGSVQGYYHIGTMTRLFVEPSYQRVLKPVTMNGYPLQQRQDVFGLKLGITRILK